jgi:hypothetical protein
LHDICDILFRPTGEAGDFAGARLSALQENVLSSNQMALRKISTLALDRGATKLQSDL